MPIVLDYAASSKRFADALALAKGSGTLPEEWLERTRVIGRAPSKTFVAMLGTALLAKATNPQVDPFALKVRNHARAYSARNLCKDVLVPCAVDAGVHLGTTGREPLNNQPFFRHERVAPDMSVHPSTRPHLRFLCESLTAADTLRAAESLRALAAFLRVRLNEAPRYASVAVGDRTVGAWQLAEEVVPYFVERNPEGGKRGQALVAAAFDLMFDDVRTSRVYDPSRHWPGDVAVVVDGVVTRCAEVKQRSATETEILQFVAKCAGLKIQIAFVALLSQQQRALDERKLVEMSWKRHGVHLTIVAGTAALLRTVLAWTSQPLPQALARFPQLFANRLREVEVSEAGLADWVKLFDTDQ